MSRNDDIFTERRLLIVEDNDADAELVCDNLELLAQTGFHFTRAHRLGDAQQALKEQDFDAIILDLGLPDSTGIETLKSILAHAPNTPTIVASGNADPVLQDKCRRLGAWECLSKSDGANLLMARLIAKSLTEQQADKQHRWMSKLIADAPDAVIVADTEGVVRFINNTALELFGRPREDFLGEFLGFSVAKGLVSEIEILRDSVRRSAEIRVVDFEWDDRPAFLATIRDITEQKEAAEELRQAQKLEAIGRLAGGIAHDFNNLLTVLSICAEMLEADLASGQPDPRDVEEVARTVARGRELTRQLLSFSRRQPDSPAVLKPDHVLKELYPMLRRTLPAHVECVVLHEHEPWPVRLDRVQLEQLLTNLVINANDAMPEGGTLTLAWRNLSLARGDFVELEVTDTGHGMSEAVRQRIFEPFYTTKGAGKGTGLGLATCFGIVRRAGGEISVDSAPGRGTSFLIRFPRSTGEVTLPQVAEEDYHGRLEGQETLLVVEDDHSLLRSLTRILTNRGYQVGTASNGQEAISKIREGFNPDLVVADIMMPQVGGGSLCDWLRAHRPGMPVLLMSGYAADFELPVDGYFLAKPFLSRELLRKVRQVLEVRPPQG